MSIPTPNELLHPSRRPRPAFCLASFRQFQLNSCLTLSIEQPEETQTPLSILHDAGGLPLARCGITRKARFDDKL
jgi:hypothetical protein